MAKKDKKTDLINSEGEQLPDVQHPSRNFAWNSNHALIRDAYISILAEKKRRPTAQEVAERTTLNITTVYGHLSSMKFDPQEPEFRLLTSDVLLALYRSCVKYGKAAEVKLWMQIVEGMKFTEDEGNGQLRVEKAVIQIVPAPRDQNNTKNGTIGD